jgi:hypothetical protein
MASTQQQWYTLFFMVAVAALTIAYDVAVYRAWGAHATISQVCLTGFEAYPVLLLIVVFALGVLIGHLALPQ